MAIAIDSGRNSSSQITLATTSCAKGSPPSERPITCHAQPHHKAVHRNVMAKEGIAAVSSTLGAVSKRSRRLLNRYSTRVSLEA